MAQPERPLRLEDIPVMNFGQFMIDQMRKFGDQEAIIDGFTKQAYSYKKVVKRAECLAAGLQELGVKPGDVICIAAPNHIDYHVTFYATSLINAVLQAVNPLFTRDDLNKVFRECNTQIVVTIDELVPKVNEARTGLDHIKVVTFGQAKGCIPFERLLTNSGKKYHTPQADWKSSIVVLLYSSGTTGFPKAVKTSHYALIANAVQAIHSGGAFEDRECLVSFVPMFHLTGLVLVGSIAHSLGCKLVFMPRFDVEEYLSLIQTYKPPGLVVVPPIMVMLAKHPKVSEYDLSSVKRIICGAAPLSAEIEEAVKNKLNLTNIQQGYGMTEVGVTHANIRDKFKHNSVGKLLELVEMKIVDVETGKTLEANREGEVWIRGPQVTSGYLNLPAATKEMFLQDGWVRTGDIGRVDEDGFLFIVDRLKELIKYKGFQVAPAALEDILLRHDAVADVGVIGFPDEEAGELPKAFVVRKAEKHVSEKELQDFVSGLVAPYMKLRGGVAFVDEIPRSMSGKILRRTLRAMAGATRSRL